MKKEREIWVDIIKSFACALVVLGHFFQSMTKSDLLSDGFAFQWFDRTIYMFHVPLFFICSGYLYQKYTFIDSIKSWKDNLLKKLISLGIPYFVFSIITWVLKNIASSSVNNETDGLLHTLFVMPESPYWYLYILFFLNLSIPTMRKKWCACSFFGLTLVLKILSDIGFVSNIYFVSGVMTNGIWFVLGMLICFINIPQRILENKRAFRLSISSLVLFLMSSLFVIYYDIDWTGIDFLLGLIACMAIMIITLEMSKQYLSMQTFAKLAVYSMPVFLLHTIFAAGIRIILFKVGVTHSLVHVVIGITASFICPILVSLISKHIKFIEFIFYPSKYIKLNSSQR